MGTPLRQLRATDRKAVNMPVSDAAIENPREMQMNCMDSKTIFKGPARHS